MIWIDILFKVFLGMLILGFFSLMLVICIVVTKYAIEERKERKHVHALSERPGRDGDHRDLRR